MTAYKFAAHKNLRSVLDNVETVQKNDIHDYSWGHLNERNLNTTAGQGLQTRIWKSSKHMKPLDLKREREEVKKSPSPRQKSRNKDKKMRDVLYDFSVGTTGSVPVQRKRAARATPPRRDKIEEFKRETTEAKTSEPRSVSAGSEKSLYTQLDDGVLVEELKPQEIMVGTPRIYPAQFLLKKMTPEDENYDIMDDLTQTLDRDGLLTYRHTFLPSYTTGVTKSDQYYKMKQFETSVLRKQDSQEQNVLSGVKAVEHLEKRLNEDLEMMNLSGMGPNFHKLQVFSNSLEDLIDETPTFGFILKCIKSEYDNYITKLLDSQTPQHSRLLRDQVEQMSARGTSRPDELHDVKSKVWKLENQAKELLEENKRLRDMVAEEEDWLNNAPEPEPPQMQVTKLYVDDTPVELADEIEHGKALILEKLDALTELRTRLRQDHVPLTVCNHLEQCIKETEIEVQKLLKQNEYFERSNNEMEMELKESIQDADTSERDAKRIWKKVNSLKGLPRVNLGRDEGVIEDSEDEEDDETKWNWYIS